MPPPPPPPPSSHPSHAYKILPASALTAWRESGSFSGSGIDLSDGYIHLSTAGQSAVTYAKYFAGQQQQQEEEGEGGLAVAEVELSKISSSASSASDGRGGDAQRGEDGGEGKGKGSGGVVRWEASRGGDLFAHVYGEIPYAAVSRTWDEVNAALFDELAAAERSGGT